MMQRAMHMTVAMVAALTLLGGCGGSLEAEEARHLWADLDALQITALVRVEDVAAAQVYSAPARCPGGGSISGSTMQTWAGADHGGEVTAYVQYQLRDCRPQAGGSHYSGALRRALQHRLILAQPASGQPATYGEHYDHFSGALTVSGGLAGECELDLHRRVVGEPASQTFFRGTLCGHAASVVLAPVTSPPLQEVSACNP